MKQKLFIIGIFFILTAAVTTVMVAEKNILEKARLNHSVIYFTNSENTLSLSKNEFSPLEIQIANMQQEEETEYQIIYSFKDSPDFFATFHIKKNLTEKISPPEEIKRWLQTKQPSEKLPLKIMVKWTNGSLNLNKVLEIIK
jgi:hypothetical protein